MIKFKQQQPVTVEYMNRHNEIHRFTLQPSQGGRESIIWEMPIPENTEDILSVRSSLDPETGNISMVDPEGGPCITWDMNMGEISSTFKDKIVYNIFELEHYYRIILK